MKKVFSFVLAFVIIFGVTGCKSQKKKYTHYTLDYFDTATTIIGFADSQNEFDKVCGKIEAKLDEYHKLYNIYEAYEGINNLHTVNKLFDGQHKEIPVDRKIIDMLLFSKEIYNKTQGNTNIAFGSVLSIWHTHRTQGIKNPDKAELPDYSELKQASLNTNIDDVIIDTKKNTVYLANDNMTLDVGAVAKGYAVEMIAKWMREENISGYILNVGGNVRIVGDRPDREKWTVGIENPNNTENYVELLQLGDSALVTSGAYQRYYTVNGKNYHHIINPQTLMPNESYLSVSVLSDNSALADGLSTALFNLSLAEGKKIVASMDGVEAMWVLPNNKREYSKGFKNYIMDKK